MPRSYLSGSGTPGRMGARPAGVRPGVHPGSGPVSLPAQANPRQRHAPEEGRLTKIERFSLSIPGRTPEAGERIAKRVTEQLAVRLPPGVSGHFERLELRLQQLNTSEFSISEAIVSAIIASLEKRSTPTPERA